MAITRKKLGCLFVVSSVLLLVLVCAPWTILRPYRAYACRNVGEDVVSGRLAPDAQGYVHVSYPWVAIDDRALGMRQADGSAVVLFVQAQLYRQDWIGMVYHKKPLSPPFITVWPGFDPSFVGPRGEPVRVRPYRPNVSYASYLES